ncbi:uncharacterized protein FIBRA_02599 [Fibroporia radiculosa]|uniref:Glucose-methanol-choline oxidoreductase N-terminal domain-containing protein n=1 Tax=Fibroporia radiculosa TaxID=599839 RepID=J4GN00_9APHY|nr:uncharacterized protein FIBRA_02599 [Fibroporia radiculosa]CCM00565.1 predicted protein [Fibroporia radiculosa]
MLATVDQVVNRTFDYIICGGGTAGLTLAARLSEDPNISVLVLEAGAANIGYPSVLDPGLYLTNFTNADLCWFHTTTEQENAASRQIRWLRGKGLGGSSQINFLGWLKPPADEIDAFERLGNPGWNWKNYQMASERVEGFAIPGYSASDIDDTIFENVKLGVEGPVKITYPTTMEEALVKVWKTFLKAGLPVSSRPTSGNAYYLPNRDRKNLNVLVGAEVGRIIPEKRAGGSLTATGVEFTHTGQTFSAYAHREVIVSAGALKTPQILELSGIGRKDVLESIGVPVKVELPGVGENAQDHVSMGVTWELRDGKSSDTIDLLRNTDLSVDQLHYGAPQAKHTSVRAAPVALAPLQLISDKADILVEVAQTHFSNAAYKDSPGLHEQYEIQLERMRGGAASHEFASVLGHLSTPNPPLDGKRYRTQLVINNNCFSRGSIHCRSANPKDDPTFDGGYFNESIDLDIMVEMVKFVRGIAKKSPWNDMIVEESNPGPGIKTDQQIRGKIVDPHFVYGTTNIRVVDLSIVPLHFAAHPLATVYAIAEQGKSPDL